MIFYGRKKNKEKKTYFKCFNKASLIMFPITKSRGKTSVVIEKKAEKK